MLATDAQKRATAKWDSENMTTVSCRGKKESAARFKRACAINGVTVNAALRAYVDNGTTGFLSGGSADGTTLPPDVLREAQEAAKLEGEELGAFIKRAISEQKVRDKRKRQMQSLIHQSDAPAQSHILP